MNSTPLPELQDEWLNSLTHGIGLILSLIGLGCLVYYSIEEHSLKLLTYSIFGFSLVLLYGASTFYHSCTHLELKKWLRIVDHCAIYILIAGSYTPFTLISLKGAWGHFLFFSIWSLAIMGILYKIFFFGKFEKFSLFLYLLMGWLVVIAIEPLMANLSTEGLYWTFGGGLFYTSGVIFFVLDARRFCHAIWHVFVMGGSFCHYCAIFFHT